MRASGTSCVFPTVRGSVASVQLEDVTFRYPGATADTLQTLSLVVGNGTTHALLGGSGAGKTTVLNLLSGLLQPTGGRILMDGHDIGGLPAARRNVTQVFQFPVLYPAMTVLENLCFPLRNRKWKPAAARERALAMAEELDVSPLLDRRPSTLTLFERQLVAIGRALVRPDVGLVLLDEPLTAVQPELKWRLRRALRRVQRDLGVTMVYVTHDQTEALTFAERVSVMHDGRILQTASPVDVHDEPAHEFVGYFIGSPGMNLLEARVESGMVYVAGTRVGGTVLADGDYRMGFRAQWAAVADAGLPASVRGVRYDGVVDDSPVGVLRATVADKEVYVRHAGLAPDGPMHLRVNRFILFREGWRAN
ncbi:MAG: ABC transporter ATP-binding protein [Pseudomonadales bacterium]|nr:ABC transporter ATP-binding protein [Pseudomonadales bacterium]